MPNNDKDFTIKTEGTGETIAQIICEEIGNSLSENIKYYERAKKRQNQYDQITKWMEEGKTCTEPWDGAADYFVPLTEWIIDAVWGRVLKILFFKKPFMKAKGTEAKDVDKQEGVTEFVNQIHTEVVNLYDNFRFYVKQMLILPFAVLKYAWVYDVDKSYEEEEATIFMNQMTGEKIEVLPEEEEKMQELQAAGYLPIGTDVRTVLKEQEIYNGPKLQYLKFDDYVWSGKSKRGYKPYWEGDRFWLTINEMKNNEMFDQEVVTRLKANLALETGSTMASQVIAERGKLFECFHWYGRLPINKDNSIDFANPEAIEHEVHGIVVYEEKELLMLNRWEYNRIPSEKRVYIRGEFEETEDFGGRSLTDKLYMTQKELNTLHNSIMNNAMLCMMKIFTKRKTLKGEEWERPQLKPGMFLEIDMPGDVGVLDVGDVKSISWELEASFINFAERLSNISIYQTGTARQGGGQKTKGEVERTVYEGNIGMDKFVAKCAKVLKTISQWTVDYYYNNMPEGLERRINGEDGNTIFPTEENRQQFEDKDILPYWRSDDITGKFDFDWENTSLNSSEAFEVQIANDLQDRYLPHPMIAGSLLATWDILRRGLEARKIKDWQNILPPKKAIIEEMQKQEEEAKEKAQAQQQEQEGGAMVSAAVKQAAQMGVPPEEAQKIVQSGGV